MRETKSSEAKLRYMREYTRRNKEKKRLYDKEYCARNKEKKRAQKQKYYYINIAAIKENMRAYTVSPEGRFASYRASATYRGYLFELTKEEFLSLWQKPCWYCGSEIKTIGIDRVDSTRGYTSDNVKPCCGTCNRMKNKFTYADFVRRCSIIADRHKGVS